MVSAGYALRLLAVDGTLLKTEEGVGCWPISLVFLASPDCFCMGHMMLDVLAHFVFSYADPEVAILLTKVPTCSGRYSRRPQNHYTSSRC